MMKLPTYLCTFLLLSCHPNQSPTQPKTSVVSQTPTTEASSEASSIAVLEPVAESQPTKAPPVEEPTCLASVSDLSLSSTGWLAGYQSAMLQDEEKPPTTDKAARAAMGCKGAAPCVFDPSTKGDMGGGFMISLFIPKPKGDPFMLDVGDGMSYHCSFADSVTVEESKRLVHVVVIHEDTDEILNCNDSEGNPVDRDDDSSENCIVGCTTTVDKQNIEDLFINKTSGKGVQIIQRNLRADETAPPYQDYDTTAKITEEKGGLRLKGGACDQLVPFP
jgi:hypothetical protein